MGFLGSSKSATTTQKTSVDNRQVDAKVTAQDSNVITAGAGTLNYTDDSGSIRATDRSTINIDSTSPQAWAFGSEMVERAFNAVGAAQASAGSQVAGIGETIASLAQGKPIGMDWKVLAWPIAAVAVVLGLVLLRRKG